MIKIQFDHQAFSMQRFGGISRYFANIQDHLKGYSAISFDRGLLFTNNYYLKGQSLPVPGWAWRKLVKRDKKIAKYNKSYSKYCLKNHNYDIFHPTYYNPYFLDIVKKPFVLTVHDCIHELFPEYFPESDHTAHYKRLLIDRAAHLIAISASTKNDLQRIYDIPDERISMIYHGYEAPQGLQRTVDKTGAGVYILFVGDRAAYKNFFKWLTAVAPLLKRYDINAVCGGGKPFTSTEHEFINRLGVAHKIRQMQVTEAELARLYSNALFFVYPSLYEGFGFPILEAFTNNCAVLAGNTSCFKEVAGGAALYFDPYSIESMQVAMESLINDQGNIKRLQLAGKDQLAKFPIEKCMQQTVQVYQSLI